MASADAPEPAGTPAERLRDFLDRVADALGVPVTVEVTEDDETLRGDLRGDELGLLIGRHGQTIDAIQHLGYRIAYRSPDGRKRVEVDASGYRERRASVLREDADQAAEEAVSTGREVALDAMNAVERRVVHEYLRERGGVDTHSEGNEPDRYLVITPAHS